MHTPTIQLLLDEKENNYVINEKRKGKKILNSFESLVARSIFFSTVFLFLDEH